MKNTIDFKRRQAFSTNFLYLIFTILVFFPYITPIQTGSDVQPYSLLFAIIIIPLFIGTKLPKIYYFFLAPLLSAIIITISSPNVQSLRSLYGYLSFTLVFLATYLCCLRGGAPSKRIIHIIVITWGLAGLCQLYISPNIFSFILPRETSFAQQGGRGVESLSAEPTFYGFILIIFLILYIGRIKHEKISTKADLMTIVFVIFQIIFISRSSSAIFTLMTGAAIWFIVGASLKTKLYTSIFVAVAIIIFILNIERFNDVRAVRLLFLLTESPERFLLIDQSANSRIFHIYYSISAFITDFGLPHGFNSWTAYVFEMTSYNHYATTDGAAGHGRVMSFLGGLLYELGFLSLPLIFVIFYIPSKFFKGSEFRLPILFTMFVLLIQSVPLSLPILPFVLAVLYYWHSESKKQILKPA